MSDAALYVVLVVFTGMCGWIVGYKDGQSRAEDK